MLKLVLLSVAIGGVIGLFAGFTGMPSPWAGLLTGAICGAVAAFGAGKQRRA